jgi:hypothetical protein
MGVNLPHELAMVALEQNILGKGIKLDHKSSSAKNILKVSSGFGRGVG